MNEANKNRDSVNGILIRHIGGNMVLGRTVVEKLLAEYAMIVRQRQIADLGKDDAQNPIRMGLLEMDILLFLNADQARDILDPICAGHYRSDSGDAMFDCASVEYRYVHTDEQGKEHDDVQSIQVLFFPRVMSDYQITKAMEG